MGGAITYLRRSGIPPAPILPACHPDVRKDLRLPTSRLRASPIGLHTFVIFVTFSNVRPPTTNA
jgi:hypothetical protein